MLISLIYLYLYPCAISGEKSNNFSMVITFQMLSNRLAPSIGLLLITLIIIASGVDRTHAFAWTGRLVDTCKRNGQWVCDRDDALPVPDEVVEVCEACGQYWSNTPGLTWCCRCNDRVYAFCYEAVYGEPLY